MAGAGFKTFATGDVLTASDVNTYLMQQTVMVFASSAARSTALGGNVAQGMLSYLKDSNTTAYYDGTAWQTLSTGGDITAVTTAANSGLSGGGTSGAIALTLATTAKGNLLVGTGSGTAAELAVGTNGQILTADSSQSTGLNWATPAASSFIGAKVYNSTDSTIANATWTSLAMNSETLDTDNFHSTVSNTSRITIPSGKAGKYIFTCFTNFGNNGTGDRRIALAKNGTRLVYLIFTPSSANYTMMTYSTVVSAAVNDYFEIQVYQNSGGNLTSYGGSDVVDFTATFVGA